MGVTCPKPGNAWRPRSWKGAGTDTSPEPGGVWPSGHLAFRLLGPRTVREYIFALSCHQVWDNLLQQPQQTHTMIRKWGQSGDRGLAGVCGIGVTSSSDWGCCGKVKDTSGQTQHIENKGQAETRPLPLALPVLGGSSRDVCCPLLVGPESP